MALFHPRHPFFFLFFIRFCNCSFQFSISCHHRTVGGLKERKGNERSGKVASDRVRTISSHCLKLIDLDSISPVSVRSQHGEPCNHIFRRQFGLRPELSVY